MQERMCVYDSSAFFVQDHVTRREVLIFGDVEPDSLSLSPRTLLIWQEAAPKIASGNLKAIFIECSYPDSQDNERLYGHLKPLFVMQELRILASEVEHARTMRLTDNKKRKRIESMADEPPRRVPSHPGTESPVSPKTIKASIAHDAYLAGPSTPHLSSPTAQLTIGEPVGDLDVTSYPSPRTPRPLEGLKVIIIHVKDVLDDEDPVGDTILAQLKEHEKTQQLGCEFIVSHQGQDFYL